MKTRTRAHATASVPSAETRRATTAKLLLLVRSTAKQFAETLLANAASLAKNALKTVANALVTVGMECAPPASLATLARKTAASARLLAGTTSARKTLAKTARSARKTAGNARPNAETRSAMARRLAVRVRVTAESVLRVVTRSVMVVRRVRRV